MSRTTTIRHFLPLGLGLALALGGCDDGAAVTPQDGADATDVNLADTSPDGPDTTADTSPDTGPDGADTSADTEVANHFEVGPRACCLAVEGDRVVWSEDGDLWELDLATGRRAPLVVAPGLQLNPAISGSTLVWSDGRGGDLDLWVMDLGDEAGQGRTEPRLLRGGPGDQDQASLDGDRLVWIGKDDAPHTAREAEVWTMRLSEPANERRLTTDAFEQTQPDVSGDRIVWADFAHSPDAIYIDVADPLRNNADIFGWDLGTDKGFIVTDNPTKQLRPAISGDAVTWLDWRDINPEPKYSEFQVFARRLREGPDGVERRLAWSSWSRPELWRRPAIDGDLVVFVAEPSTPGTSFLTGVLAVRVDGGAPWLVAGSTSVIESVAVRDRTAIWLGGGQLGKSEIRVGR